MGPVPPGTAFAVSQTTGEVRLRWDPFIRHQHLIDAEAPGKDVRTLTKARIGPTMISRYVSYRAVWKYTWSARPGWLAPVADPIGRWLLGREIRARIAAFARACEDPEALGVV
jgi:hypothetical protein